MDRKFFSNLPCTGIFAGLITALTVASWTSVNAQVNQGTPNLSTAAPPKFINAEDAGQFNIQGTGKSFQPSRLGSSETPYDQPRAIIRRDDRIPVISRKYPWSAIGRIVGRSTNGNLYTCTGTLISENVVLTNSHCVIDPKTHQPSKRVAFLPNVIDGKLQDDNDIAVAQKVLYGTDFTKDKITNQTKDWEIRTISTTRQWTGPSK